ncbi:MAG: caspase family protein [Oscillatoriophycideae cyanobacterium NC_groundwater_1537_Pr4_S-0.65um_50_18]|nr:caspase family protein [Oscillatoriophycideae cyanobacterium NC_groundwater_1537_Pr4_S-0.65um_50_18]
MCPASVRTSRVSRALETGEAKLWVLLVGVNQYEDVHLPDLSCPALDCQGLGEAIAAATQTFPQKAMQVHHDSFERYPYLGQPHPGRLPPGQPHPVMPSRQPAQPPKLRAVYASLQQIVAEAKPQDTVLFYFSGHGILDDDSHQAVLCLTDTRKQALAETGLSVEALLNLLNQCAAHQQLVWLDACHSGSMTFRAAQGKDLGTMPLPNPTPQMVELLRQRAAQSKGFYALLSCDQAQQSWEFPELGHGVFTYFLMRGLLGEAADEQGVIEVDALYKYVYYQTLRYIDKTNQQLRLINQQKRGRGETQLQPEYPLQTPKRIVEGVGELILGLKPEAAPLRHPRQAFMIEGLGGNAVTLSMSKVLQAEGGFQLRYFPQPKTGWARVKEAIAAGLKLDKAQGGQPSGQLEGHPGEDLEAATVLLYLRGRVAHTEAGEARLLLKDGVEISRSWLRQVLRRSPISHQIIILDCPGATDLGEWVEDLQVESGQCVIAAASPLTYPDTFASVLLETLTATDPQAGLPIAGWIAQIQAMMVGNAIAPYVWLSGNRVIEVLPSRSGLRQEEAEFDLNLCPYLGLKAFAEQDAPFFFGREPLIQQLIQAADRSLLAVVGASGSGKSSVVMAGLMAELRQGKRIPGSDEWWMGSLRPGAHPVEALIHCLAEGNTEADRKYHQLQLEGLLYQGAEGFVHWLRSCPEPIMVLVVDQFEELFTLASVAERQRFLDLLLGGLEHASDRFKLILTLRTDFMAACLEYPALAEQLQGANLLVPSVLSEADYRQVILRPAEKVGLAVQPELVEVLLQDLSHSAGDLPLLEFVLEQLWEHRAPGELTLQVYQQQIGGLRGALERKAQSVYDGLDPAAQACAQWIFLSLTQLGEGTEDTRRRVTKADLVVNKYPVALVDRTLQALTAAKLVIVATDAIDIDAIEGVEAAAPRSLADLELDALVDPESLNPFAPKSDLAALSLPTTTIEVAHEILIRHWSTLRWWLEENRARLRSQRQIELAAHQWQQSGQQPDFLLRGVRLDAAEEIYVKYTDELSQDVQQFIEAGLEERQATDRQNQQRLKRAQRTIALIGTLGIAAAGLGGFAYVQGQRSQLNEIKTLNALSESQLLSNHSLEALTTALEATRRMQKLGWIDGLGYFSGDAADVKSQTIATLQQAVEESQEQNRLEHSAQVNSLSVSPDGQRIVSGSDDAIVRLWRSDGTALRTWETSGRVQAVAFSPDGQTVATASLKDEASVLALWSMADGKLLREINAPTLLTSLAFSPNGSFVAAGGRDGITKIWNAQNGTLLRTLTGHQGWVKTIAFSPDSRTLASAGDDNVVKLWNVVKSQLIRNFEGHPASINSVTFSPDGKRLVAAGDIAQANGNAVLTLWTIATGKAQTLEGHRAPINSVTFSPDGQLLLSASSDATLRLWRTQDGAWVQTLKGHGGSVLTAQFSPSGKTVFSGSADKTVRSWDIRSIQPPTDSAYALSLSTDRILALAGWDGNIRLWSQDKLQPLKSWAGHKLPVSALDFSPDGSLLASGGDDQSVNLWDAKTGELVRSLTGHKARISSLSFSPTDNLLISGSDDQTLRLWNLTDGQLVRSFSTAPDSPSSVAFSPDGRLLATGGYSNTVKLWRIDGTLLHTLAGHGLAVAAIAFSPDGNTLASASWDNTIKLWQVKDGQLLHTLTGHQDGVTSLVFSPEGNILASGGADKTLRFWNPQTGDLLKTLVGQTDPLLSLNFSSDDKTLFSASEASGFHHWDLDLDRLLKTGCDRLQDYLRTSPHLDQSDRQLCS